MDLSKKDPLKTPEGTSEAQPSNNNGGDFKRASSQDDVSKEKLAQELQASSQKAVGESSSGSRTKATVEVMMIPITDLSIPSSSSLRTATAGRLFVSNLHYSFRDINVKRIFKKMGQLQSARVNFDVYGNSLRTAQLIFNSRNHALKAVEEFNGRWPQISPLRVEIVTPEVPPYTDLMAPMRIFVSQIHFEVDNLEYLFGQAGPLLNATMHYNRQHYPFGTADVCFEHGKDALDALREFSGYVIRGLPIRCELLTSYVPPNTDSPGDKVGEGEGEAYDPEDALEEV